MHFAHKLIEKSCLLNVKKCLLPQFICNNVHFLKPLLGSAAQAAPASVQISFDLVPHAGLHVAFGISHLNNRSNHSGVQYGAQCTNRSPDLQHEDDNMATGTVKACVVMMEFGIET